MKFLIAALLFTSTLFLLGQSKELSVKTELRVVIYEGDQYKAWYSAYHKDDLLKPRLISTEENKLSRYEKRWERQKDKARAKEQLAKIYHESYIPMEIVFMMNADSLPFPVITEIKVNKYQDSLITVDFEETSFDNLSSSQDNGQRVFNIDYNITNSHIAKNDEGKKIDPLLLHFFGEISFKEGEKDQIKVRYGGTIYSRQTLPIYKIEGKEFSYIPLFYRHLNDFERQLEALTYK